MNVLKATARTFVYVLTGSILSTATFLQVFAPEVTFTVMLLWQVIAMSVAGALGTLIFYTSKEIGKKQMMLRTFLHYAYINIIVFSTAFLCGWVDLEHKASVFVLFLLIAAVYCGVSMAMMKKEKKTAEDMNERLREIYPEEDDPKD